MLKLVIDAHLSPRRILFDVNEAIHSNSSISPNRMDEFNVRLKEFEASLELPINSRFCKLMKL